MEAQTVPKPPRKPLTPYMRFSKAIWQSVKSANQNLSVCEIGATIGKMWRDLGDQEKQHWNTQFVEEKAKYDDELSEYLRKYNLTAADLSKKKKKDTDSGKKGWNRKGDGGSKGMAARAMQAAPQQQLPPPQQMQQQVQQMQQMQQMMAMSQVGGLAQMNMAAFGNQGAGALPSFSQIWPTPGYPTQNQMVMAAGGMAIPNNMGQQQTQGSSPYYQMAPADTDGGQANTPQPPMYNGSPMSQPVASSPHQSLGPSPQEQSLAGGQMQGVLQSPHQAMVPSPHQQQLTSSPQQGPQPPQQQAPQPAQQMTPSPHHAMAPSPLNQQMAQSPLVPGGSPMSVNQSVEGLPPPIQETKNSENSSDGSMLPGGEGAPSGPPATWPWHAPNMENGQAQSQPAPEQNPSTPAEHASPDRSQSAQPQSAATEASNQSDGKSPEASNSTPENGQTPNTEAGQQGENAATTTYATLANYDPGQGGQGSTFYGSHFPWTSYDGAYARQQPNFNYNAKPVFTKESIMESELQHLRVALADKTKEVQRLRQELQKAYETIDRLKQDRAGFNV